MGMFGRLVDLLFREPWREAPETRVEGASSVTINGRRYVGNNVRISGGYVEVDGVRAPDSEQPGPVAGPVQVVVNGSCGRIDTVGPVTVHGDSGDIDTVGPVTVQGDSGNVDAVTVTVGKSVLGNVDAVTVHTQTR